MSVADILLLLNAANYRTWRKSLRPYLQMVNLQHSIRSKCHMNRGLQKHGFRFSATWLLEKMLKVKNLSVYAGYWTSEQWLPDSLENSRCPTNHLKPIPLLCLTFWTSLTVVPQRVESNVFRYKSINQGNAQAMLLVHLVLEILPETRCSRIVAMQAENVVEHQHVWTKNGFTSCSSSGRTFRWKLWSTARLRRVGRK